MQGRTRQCRQSNSLMEGKGWQSKKAGQGTQAVLCIRSQARRHGKAGTQAGRQAGRQAWQRSQADRKSKACRHAGQGRPVT
jgi:hypothetical protein